jgi:DNA-binding MarR family transcriptional regulator
MSELDAVIHAPKRLRIMAIASTFDRIAFALLKERLELSAPDLSKQLRTLEGAGYLTTRKTGRGPGSQTWVTLTRAGREAYQAHVAALRALFDGTAAEFSDH